MAEVKLDRRTQRTRRLLVDALVELMLEQRFEAISVQDILDRADVGRSTFYGHFTSKEDLLYSSLEQMLHSLAQPIAAETGATSLLPSLGLFRHVKAQQRLHKALFAGNQPESMARNLQQHLARVVERNLAAMQPPGNEPSVPLLVLAEFVAGTFYTLLRWWLEGNDAYSPEQVDTMFQQMVMPGVKAALGNGGTGTD